MDVPIWKMIKKIDYTIPLGKFVVLKLMNLFTDFEANCINQIS